MLTTVAMCRPWLVSTLAKCMFLISNWRCNNSSIIGLDNMRKRPEQVQLVSFPTFL